MKYEEFITKVEANLLDNLDVLLPNWEFKFKGEKYVSKYHVEGHARGREAHDGDGSHIYTTGKYIVDSNRRTGDNSKENIISIIDAYMLENGMDVDNDYWLAVESIATKLGYDVSNVERDATREEIRQKAKERRERQQALDSILQQCNWALFSNSADATNARNYIYGRGWTESQAGDVKLGYISETAVANIKQNFPALADMFQDNRIGQTHRLLIPYWTGTEIVGFKFRAVDTSTQPKYINTTGLKKLLLGLRPNVKSVVIVEGDLDALHLQANGFSNACCTAGGSLTDEQIQQLKKYGVEEITLSFDNDERGKQFTRDSALKLLKQGFKRINVCWYERQDVKDVDEYLQKYGFEDWQREYNVNRVSFPFWEFGELSQVYINKASDNGGFLKQIQQEEYLRGVADIIKTSINDENIVAYDKIKQVLKDSYEKYNLPPLDEFFKVQERILAESVKERNTEATKAKIKEIEQLFASGDSSAAFDKIAELKKDSTDVGLRNHLSDAFRPMQAGDVNKLIAGVSEGLPTGYRIERGGRPAEPLLLNTGLNFVAACTGHGKTTFLNNVALNVARRNIIRDKGERVLYFSYEIDKRRILATLENTFINDEDLGNGVSPLKAIYEHAKGNTQAINAGKLAEFERKQQQFNELFTQGAGITVVEDSLPLEKLVEAIRYYTTLYKCNLVCLDYVQLIKTESYQRQRTEEIKAVVNELKDLSNDIDVPFLMAAQFNRQVIGLDTITADNIGEGGDIERIATLIVGLYDLRNLKERQGADNKQQKQILNNCGIEAAELKPIDDRMFFKILKNRYGETGAEFLLPIKHKTRYIEPNLPESIERAEWTETKQAETDNCNEASRRQGDNGGDLFNADDYKAKK